MHPSRSNFSVTRTKLLSAYQSFVVVIASVLTLIPPIHSSSVLLRAGLNLCHLLCHETVRQPHVLWVTYARDNRFFPPFSDVID